MDRIESLKAYSKNLALKRAEALQSQMHDFVEAAIKKNPSISYQDATNTFFIIKIAEIGAIRNNDIVAEELLSNQTKQN